MALIVPMKERACALFLTPYSESIAKPLDENHHASRVSEHDHTKLEHNHSAARSDGQESGEMRNTMKKNSPSSSDHVATINKVR